MWQTMIWRPSKWILMTSWTSFGSSWWIFPGYRPPPCHCVLKSAIDDSFRVGHPIILPPSHPPTLPLHGITKYSQGSWVTLQHISRTWKLSSQSLHFSVKLTEKSRAVTDSRQWYSTSSFQVSCWMDVTSLQPHRIPSAKSSTRTILRHSNPTVPWPMQGTTSTSPPSYSKPYSKSM